jgi:glycosyltransferase involved in cell wall biosynthesis
MLDISVIILTYNEQLHIERAIRNAQQFSAEIFLVDSFSTDKTIEIAELLGAKVYQNKWENNHAKQFNWGLQHLPIKTKWVLRLDADEYLTDELIEEVKEKLPNLDEDVTGIILHREQDCFGRWVHPLKLLRIFQYEKAVCEQRWMDEHIQLLEGKSVEFQHKFLDHNLNTFGWWIDKHNGYSIREAIDLLNVELNLFDGDRHCGLAPQSPENTGDSCLRRNDNSTGIGKEAETKRAKKLRYAHSPLFLRSFLYFIYRYIFKFGFTKGKSQFIWDFFQGWWYRTLVDAKIHEIKKACGNDKEKIIKFVEDNYKLNLTKINTGGGG